MLVWVISTSSMIVFPTALSVEANGNPWNTKVAMPIARAGIKAGVVNDKIYVFDANHTLEYNLESWSTKKPMLTYRIDFALATYQNKIFCIGGRNSGPSAANEIYDPASNSWESKTAMPTPRHGLDANVVNGKIYLISGLIPWSDSPNVNVDRYTTFKLTNVTEVYDPATVTWVTKKPIPHAASYYASAVVDNKIYVVSEEYTQIYDTGTDTWSYGAPPPFSVDMAGGVAITELSPKRIYVIGGRGSLEVGYNQIYVPETNSWIIGTSIPTSRYGLAVCAVNNKIYAIGGLTGAFVAVTQKNTNEEYDPLKDEIKLATSTISPTFTEDTPKEDMDKEPYSLIIIVLGVLALAAIIAGVIFTKKRRRQYSSHLGASKQTRTKF